MVGQRRRGVVSHLPPALSFAGSVGGSGRPLRSLSGQGQGPGRSGCSPALIFRPALATFVSWGGWFWFKGSELAQPQTRASSWATMEHARESALRCEQSNRQGCGAWDGERRLGGLGPAVEEPKSLQPLVAARSLLLHIFAEESRHQLCAAAEGWLHGAHVQGFVASWDTCLTRRHLSSSQGGQSEKHFTHLQPHRGPEGTLRR